MEQLELFSRSGPDVVRLREELKRLAASARAPRTRQAYESDWRHFCAWCVSVARPFLPAEEETVELYLADQARSLKVSSLSRRVAAIGHYHHAAGYESPAGRRCRLVLRATAREKGAACAQKAAIAPEELRRMSEALGQEKGRVRAIRDRAVLVFGFAAGMRRSELAALDLGDVEISSQGVKVHLRRSKTDQGGEGRWLGIFPGSKAETCPVATLRAWIEARGNQAGPLFTRITMGDRATEARLSGAAVGEIVQRAVKLIGLDADRYGGHSLRAGCVTAAAAAGVSDVVIMQRTGHRSVQTLAKYVRPAGLFAVDPLRGVM